MKMQAWLAALLVLAARTVGAQDQPAAQAGDTVVPMEIVFVVFPDTTAAINAVSGLSAEQRGQVESYQVVSRDQQGNVSTGQRHDKQGGSSATEQAGQAIDGVVALLGQRPQRDTSGAGDTGGTGDTSSSTGDTSAQGYAPGQPSRGASVSPTNMTRMQDMLAPGTAAVILVVPEDAGTDLSGAMRGAEGASDVMVVELVPAP